MHPAATQSPPAPNHAADLNVAVGGLLSKLDTIETLLRAIALSLEQEPDFDQTFIVGGNIAAAAAVPFQLPRTLRHVEVTLSVTTSAEVALLAGQLTTTQASGQHNHSAGVSGNSNAIVSSGGGAVTVRDYLDESGWMTVYFTAATTGYANVRIRSLDYMQPRPQRT